MIRGSWFLVVVMLLAVACSNEPGVDGEPDGGMEDAADAFDAGEEPGVGDDAGESGDGDGFEEPDAFGDGGDGADAAGDFGEPERFSVLTINLKHPLTGMDEALQRLQIVADAINERQPDVVALQEVVKDGDRPSMAERLAGLTGYQWIWEFTYTVPTLFDEGLGIISRWPIVWSDSAELPHLDLVIFRRRALGARIQSPHGDILFFCTHMTTDHDDTVEADQALAVYQFIQDNPSPLAGFLAGDLNAEPHKLAMRFLRGEAEHQGVTGDLIDAWMAANPDDEGFTHDSATPDQRIDYVYLVPGQEKSADVVSCELMFTERVGDLYASDHLGVVCEFLLQP